MPVKLTKAQKKAHLKDPARCPYCLSPDIEGGSVDITCAYAYQNVTCTSCDRHWTDYYTLDRISEY